MHRLFILLCSLLGIMFVATAQTESLEVGQIALVTWNSQDDVAYQFSASAGQVLDIQVYSANQLDTRISIENAGNSQIAYNNDSKRGVDPFIHNFIAPSDGIYTIRLRNLDESQIPVTLALRESALLTISDAPIEVDLRRAHEEILILQGQAGVSYQVRVTRISSDEATISPTISVKTPSGDLLSSIIATQVEEASTVFTVETAGDIYILVEDFTPSVLNVQVQVVTGGG